MRDLITRLARSGYGAHMSDKRDWDKDRQRRMRQEATYSAPVRAPLTTIRELLEFRALRPESKAGNYVVCPGSWESSTDPQHLDRLLTAHRNRACQDKSVHINRAEGDRRVRIRNEDVESLGLKLCQICAAFVKPR